MDVTAKPGADLLWAFQLHREHRALAKRLTAVETSTAHQQERITASEQNAHADQHERVDAFTERLRKLEDADVSEQVAGLASELRVTRQQLEHACDKVKLIEKANKETDSKNKDGERAVQVRMGEFASVVVQTQNAVHALEGRLGLAVDAAGHAATDGVAALSERHDEQIKGLSEQLRSLERVQSDLRALFEGDRRESTVVIPIVSSPKGLEAPLTTEQQDTTLSVPSHTQGRTNHAQSQPQAVCESPVQGKMATDMTAPQRSSKTMPPLAKTPGLAVQKSNTASKGKRKRGFEKEISQLIHGDGSLTNAPILLENQEPGTTTRGSKRFKAEAVEGRSLRSGPNPVVPANITKKQPAVTRAKALAQPDDNVVAGRKTAARTAAKRSAPKPATAATQERKGKAKSTKTPAPKKPLMSTFSEVQVAHSRTPSASKRPALPNTLESLPLPLISEKNTGKQNEKRPQQRRRRIEQDDSMEEFLAKCEAAAEI